MAVTNYLISGLPGTGKSSVCKELQLRGLYAVDADAAFAKSAQNGWVWQSAKIGPVLNDKRRDILFVCGSASNRDDFLGFFAKVFILCVDNETLKTRLLNRTNNNFGKDPWILTRQLKLNEGVKDYSEKHGRIVIDATQPIAAVVDEILAKISRP